MKIVRVNKTLSFKGCRSLIQKFLSSGDREWHIIKESPGLPVELVWRLNKVASEMGAPVSSLRTGGSGLFIRRRERLIKW